MHTRDHEEDEEEEEEEEDAEVDLLSDFESPRPAREPYPDSRSPPDGQAVNQNGKKSASPAAAKPKLSFGISQILGHHDDDDGDDASDDNNSDDEVVKRRQNDVVFDDDSRPEFTRSSRNGDPRDCHPDESRHYLGQPQRQQVSPGSGLCGTHFAAFNSAASLDLHQQLPAGVIRVPASHRVIYRGPMTGSELMMEAGGLQSSSAAASASMFPWMYERKDRLLGRYIYY